MSERQGQTILPVVKSSVYPQTDARLRVALGNTGAERKCLRPSIFPHEKELVTCLFALRKYLTATT